MTLKVIYNYFVKEPPLRKLNKIKKNLTPEMKLFRKSENLRIKKYRKALLNRLDDEFYFKDDNL